MLPSSYPHYSHLAIDLAQKASLASAVLHFTLCEGGKEKKKRKEKLYDDTVYACILTDTVQVMCRVVSVSSCRVYWYKIGWVSFGLKCGVCDTAAPEWAKSVYVEIRDALLCDEEPSSVGREAV